MIDGFIILPKLYFKIKESLNVKGGLLPLEFFYHPKINWEIKHNVIHLKNK